MKRRIFSLLALTAAAFAVVPAADAVILISTADPAANTAEPSGALAGSGWQFEGNWGAFLGTAIAPHFFVSAAHIGRADNLFWYQGSSYTIAASFNVPGTDLQIWEVVETLPSFAPLFSRKDEAGRPFVVIGRGTKRGADALVHGELHGWYWGDGDGVRRWGENVVNGSFVYQNDHNDLLYAAFDQAGLPNESQLSGGDSGGAVFINENGTWKLAGINYGVDGPFYTDAQGNGKFFGALFDARGFFAQTGSNSYAEITGATPVTSNMYATRIATQIAPIYSFIDPSGDPDHDGISNLLEYAMKLDPVTPDVAGLPAIEQSTGSLSLVYRKSTAATDLAFAVEQSSDLTAWTVAQTQDTILSTADGVQLIRATVATGDAEQMFLRLRVTRP